MPPSVPFAPVGRPRRWAAIGLCGALLLVLFVPGVTGSIMRALGWALVHNDPLEAADCIVISVDAYGPGVLEATELVRGHLSTRVAVFADPPDRTDLEFIRRGAPYYDAAALALEQLHALGVADVEIIPRAVEGTHDEASILPKWCAERSYRRILFIPSSDHSRRAGRVLRRALRGQGIRVLVHASRYSEFDPDSWWYSRTGARIELVELEKLLLDLVRHPLS